jgi:membrane protein YdbS with pleckstrin-like domain
MNNFIETLGNILAVVGILVCLVIGVIRVSGTYLFFGHEPMTWFVGGIALMVMACLAKLHVLGARFADLNRTP